MADRYHSNSPGRRSIGIGVTIALHGFAALVLWLYRSPAADPIEEAPALVAFDVEQPGPPSPEPPRPEQKETPPSPPEPVIVPVADIILPTENTIPVATVEQIATPASGGGCDLTGPVQDALRADEAVELAMPTIAPDRRSVANALALWNEFWVEPDERLPEPALAVIQATVLRTVAAASDACRRQIQRGPRLIYLPGTGRTTVLAMGSGQWTWQEVADSSLLAENISSEREPSEGAGHSKPQKRKSFERLLSDIFGR